MSRSGNYDHVSQQDYESVAGPDWPSYSDFCQHKNVADFVYQEIDAMIQAPVGFDHASFCVLPFYGLEYWLGVRQPTPTQSFCCLVPAGQDREAVKKDMLAGRRPTACEACWRLEDQGLVSDRQIKNRSIDQSLLQDIQRLLSGQASTVDSALHYKIDSNNTCNSTCMVCDSTYSSAWAQLERKHGLTPQKSWQITAETLDQDIDYVRAVSMGFRGGEPMLSDQTWHVLEKLLQANNTACFINFTTNGSVTLTAEQRALIARFKSVTFNFSIDGVGPVFEYVRYPLRWQDLESNLRYCREHGIMITASYTISNLNVFYHAQTQAWFDQNQIACSLNPVYDPVWFRPGALPKHVKHHILQQQHTPLTNFLLGSHAPQDDDDYALFRQHTAQQDSWKGISMSNYLPELCQLLG